MTSRESILDNVRTALGRSEGQPPSPAPEVHLVVPEVDIEQRIVQFTAALEQLGGHVQRAGNPAAAHSAVEAILHGCSAIASNAPFLAECGIPEIAGVQSGLHDPQQMRQAAASAGVGVTSADYALADTGTLVMLASPIEARLISLLPPVHVAVVPQSRILTDLDELFMMLPKPADQTSSLVFITGPSRTADIEQILVRGVHGPGAVHVIIVGQ